MKYFVSDTKKLPNKYGKWYWYADNEVKVFQNDKHLVIYFGYVISDESIDDVVKRDPHELEQANGNFQVAILTENTAHCIVDYFYQSKVFWRNNGRVEFTNAVYLMPLERDDLDMKEIVRRLETFTEEQLAYEPKETFERWENFIMNPPTDGRNTDELDKFRVSDQYAGIDDYQHTPGAKQYDPSQCMTLFKEVYMLQPDYMIRAVGDKINIVQIHNTYKDLMDAMNSPHEYTDQDKLEQFIHEKWQYHADVINREFKDKHVVSSVSEGIDSVAQDCYFPNVKKIAYSFDPPNVPVKYKQYMVDYWKERGNEVQWDILDISTSNIEAITKKHLNDPTCFYWDCIPTFWQMGNLSKKPDLVLYGQCGDNMFLHKAYFYYEYMFAQQMHKTQLTPEQMLEELDRELSTFKNCYSSADNILQEQKARTWQDAFHDTSKDQLLKELEEGSPDDWKHDFTKKATPPLYNREVSHNIDTLVTSLYCDKEIYFKIMNASKNIMLDNIKNAGSQKNILKKYFDFDFKTPHKDQSELNCVGMRKPMHTDIVRWALKNHLPEA